MAGFSDMTYVPRSTADAIAGDCTDDAFLGGQLRILQPRDGYRAGIDAVLLAASIPATLAAGSRILDLGAGVGTVSLSVLARVGHLSATLVEASPDLAQIALRNVERNALAARTTVVTADVTQPGASLQALGLEPESFEAVVANPPFHAEGHGTPSAEPAKARAHAMPETGLVQWVRAMARYARPGGTATVIHKAAALDALLGAFDGRFGALRVLPIHPRAGEPAIRVIVSGRKGSRAPLTLLPGFVLHAADGGFTDAARRILREGAALAM